MSTKPIRIAWQSSTPIHNFPAYRGALMAHASEILSPGSTIEPRGVRFSPPNFKYRCFDFLNNVQLFESVVAAEREGFDAIAVGCFLDPILTELREAVDIPVTSMAESSMLAACMLGRRFGVLVYSEHKQVKFIEELVERHGLERRVGPLINFDVPFEALESAMAGHPEECLKLIRAAGEKAVRGGAEVLLLGCGLLNLVAVRNGLHQIAGAPILDVTGCLLKTTEMMVTLQRVSKVAVSRVGYYAKPPQSEADDAYRRYGILSSAQPAVAG